MLITVLIILVVIILFMSLYSFSKHIRGGEYHSFKFHNKTMTSSISQLELSAKTGIVKIDGTADELIQKSAHRLQQQALMKWNDEPVYINVMNEAHLISDAHIDLLALLASGLKLNHAFACCEWHGEYYRPEYNELVTLYSNNELKIERADTFLWLYPPFTSFLSYERRDDTEEIDETFSILDEEATNLISLIEGKNRNEYNDYLRGHYTIDDMNEIFYCIPDDYYSKRLLDIHNATSISIDCSLAMHVDALKAEYYSIKSLKTVERKPRIEIYIEYSYNKETASELYSVIHRHTLNVLTYILGIKKDSKCRYIYCFRFLFPNLDEAYKKVESIDISNTKFFIYDNSGYSIVQIPKTSSAFSYDEQLFINYENENYSIQIEHSEDGSSHKSNIVEFLARNLLTTTNSIKDIRTVFSGTNYLSKDRHRFRYHTKEHSDDITNSVIYKSFGSKARLLFEKH